MTVLVPNNGEGDALKYILNFASPENLVLRLFTSNTTPAETDTTATYTEATGFGRTDRAVPPQCCQCCYSIFSTKHEGSLI